MSLIVFAGEAGNKSFELLLNIENSNIAIYYYF